MGMFFRPSAGAIVLQAAQLDKMLVLDQVRKTGERQCVAPKGGIEANENTLEAALREVHEETGIEELTLLGYLGQQRFGFLLDDGQPGEKTVDWFLMQAGDSALNPRAAEGFGEGRWYTYDDARSHLTHHAFTPFVDKAELLANWRISHGIGASAAMHAAIAEFCREAHILCSDEDASLVLCGSAARGDYVDGWSDLDFVAYTSSDGIKLASKLSAVASSVEDQYGIHIAARVGDARCREVTEGGPLYDMKLRAVARRAGIDAIVICGRWAGVTGSLPPEDLIHDLEIISAAARKLLAESGRSRPTPDGHRRALSVMCSASRLVACEADPLASLLLLDVAQLIEKQHKGLQVTHLLREYDAVRTSGTVNPADLAALALAAPEAIDELRDIIGTAT
jgi:8-oxo-dGTP pyrophosphatase MutT (NUDIX family)/predicted nucleotidyltransferase